MTLTPRQTRKQVAALLTLAKRLEQLPVAVEQIHRQIDTGPERRGGEDAGVRSIGGHSDPTGETAIARTAAYEHHLDDVEFQLRSAALSVGLLADHVNRWVMSAANREEHPRCSPQGVEPWSDPSCTNFVSHNIRNDGSYSYRQDGLCDACRMRKHRHERREVA